MIHDYPASTLLWVLGQPAIERRANLVAKFGKANLISRILVSHAQNGEKAQKGARCKLRSNENFRRAKLCKEGVPRGGGVKWSID